jgi:tetratricopeptide (TPR) repeat protein
VGHFDLWNRGVFRDPRVQMIVADGRNHLLGTTDRFDVIVSDLFVPWHAGTGDLYTANHFRLCRDRLATGGLFAQWLPLYQLSVEEFRSIVASFLEAFPTASLWRNDFHPRQPIVCLIGYRGPEEAVFDPVKVRDDCQRMADSDIRATFLADPAGVGLLYVCDDAALRRWAQGAPLNTDDRPFIEYSSPRSHYLQKQTEVDPMWDVLAGFGPRVWPYAESITPNRSFDEISRAADLWQEAVVAGSRNIFEREFRLWKELIEIAGDMPVVSAQVVETAQRYRRRKMSERSNQLLEAVIEKADEPMSPILMLANGNQIDGDEEEAINLLQRAVQLAPDRPDIQRTLVELLTTNSRFEEAEPLLKQLVEALPDEADLRLDLARCLHRQDKTAEAAEQVEIFRKLDLGDRRSQLWARLRTLGLGVYVDQPASANPSRL